MPLTTTGTGSPLWPPALSPILLGAVVPQGSLRKIIVQAFLGRQKDYKKQPNTWMNHGSHSFIEILGVQRHKFTSCRQKPMKTQIENVEIDGILASYHIVHFAEIRKQSAHWPWDEKESAPSY